VTKLPSPHGKRLEGRNRKKRSTRKTYPSTPQPSWATVRLPGIRPPPPPVLPPVPVGHRPRTLSVSPLSSSVSTPFQKSPTFPRRRAAAAASKVSAIETARRTTMAFASSLLPVPASRVCASPAPELAAFSTAKKSVSLAAASRRRGPRHGGNPCSSCSCPSTLSLSSALSFRSRSRSPGARARDLL
jgi:hypothetical protein